LKDLFLFSLKNFCFCGNARGCQLRHAVVSAKGWRGSFPGQSAFLIRLQQLIGGTLYWEWKWNCF